MIKKISTFFVCVCALHLQGVDRLRINNDSVTSQATHHAAADHAAFVNNITSRQAYAAIEVLLDRLTLEQREVLAEKMVQQNRQLKITSCFKMCFGDMFGTNRGEHDND